MRNTALSGVVRICRRGIVRSSAALLLAFCALAFFCSQPEAVAQDSKTPPVLPAPSAGKALVCIYRVGRFTGSASHDDLYINGIFLAKLLNGEYAFMEVPPGTVVVSGLTKMYYGSAIMSAGAALNDARKKENERIRFEAEAGQTYYLKWSSGTMATGVKVVLSDPFFGAKEMSKLHLSKPPEAKDEAKDKDKEGEKQEPK
jgi:Protein of unknown function (DUF2846)